MRYMAPTVQTIQKAGVIMRQQIDKKGRLTIPRELWAQIGIQTGGEAELFEDSGKIIIRRCSRCRYCGAWTQLEAETQLCRNCARLRCLQIQLDMMPG
jgi:AbrB family looped-hinge helix DNA binding protein